METSRGLGGDVVVRSSDAADEVAVRCFLETETGRRVARLRGLRDRIHEVEDADLGLAEGSVELGGSLRRGSYTR